MKTLLGLALRSAWNRRLTLGLTLAAEFVGRTLRDLALRQRFGLQLIASKRRQPTGDGETTNVAPSGDDLIEEGDVLLLLGDNDRLAHLDRLIGR